MGKLSKYLENEEFVDAALQQSEESDIWFTTYIQSHPDERYNILLAKKILQQFHTEDSNLSKEEKVILFAEIIKRAEAKTRLGFVQNRLYPILRYTAVAVLFFGIGALMFHQKATIPSEIFAYGFEEVNPGNNIRLIRPSGENIELEQDISDITHGLDGALIIDSQQYATASKVPESSSKFNQLVTPYGKTTRLTLSDGTTVFLNSGSRLIYPEVFRANLREVVLIGEAFFQVAPDTRRPFTVKTSDLQIKVLGTSFNLLAYPSDNTIEAVLTEGKISISRNEAGIFDKPIELSPGQLASYDRKTTTTKVITVDTDYYTLWTDGVYKFESLHLNRILKRLERYYNINFQYSNAMLGAIQISGKLELTDEIDETLERLSLAAQVNFEKLSEGNYKINR